jgi:hypothetical protein
MPTEDIKEAVTQRTPSAAQINLAARAIGAAHPELTSDAVAFKAAHLVRQNALLIGPEGQVGVKTTGVELVRQVAPGLLGEGPGPQKLDARTKDGRALQREQAELARRAAVAPKATKKIDMKEIEAKMAEAITKDSSLARSPGRRAMLREQLVKAAHEAAGLALGRLDANGVHS